MNERLWSPQMRKWARDADRHGMRIGLYKTRPGRRDLQWAGAGLPNTYRLTDDGLQRVIDGPTIDVKDGPRRIDHPVL